MRAIIGEIMELKLLIEGFFKAVKWGNDKTIATDRKVQTLLEAVYTERDEGRRNARQSMANSYEK